MRERVWTPEERNPTTSGLLRFSQLFLTRGGLRSLSYSLLFYPGRHSASFLGHSQGVTAHTPCRCGCSKRATTTRSVKCGAPFYVYSLHRTVALSPIPYFPLPAFIFLFRALSPLKHGHIPSIQHRSDRSCQNLEKGG